MHVNQSKYGKVKCPNCGIEINYRDAQIRSIPENKFYWGVVVDILSNDLGYPKNEIHEILKEMFLREPKYIKTKEGVKEVWITKSTAKLTVPEFEAYIEEIRVWSAMNLGIMIPEPNENEQEKH